jgi:hypothetical protein
MSGLLTTFDYWLLLSSLYPGVVEAGRLKLAVAATNDGSAACVGEVCVAGHDLRDDPNGVRAAIGVTGQFSAVDDLLTGEENLRLMADLNHLERSAGRERVTELLDRFALVDAGFDLLRRDAAPARPLLEPAQPPRGAVP